VKKEAIPATVQTYSLYKGEISSRRRSRTCKATHSTERRELRTPEHHKYLQIGSYRLLWLCSSSTSLPGQRIEHTQLLPCHFLLLLSK
jgi:hypothetical protein